jgi:hypothetical protein
LPEKTAPLVRGKTMTRFEWFGTFLFVFAWADIPSSLLQQWQAARQHAD